MGTCKCGATSDKVEFRNNRNMCKPCYSKQQKEYRENNKEELKKSRRSYWERTGHEVRRERVRDANQRSPEAFIRTLWHNITKKCNYKKTKIGKLNEACLDVKVDYEYLIKLYKDQDGKCALSKLMMTWEFGNIMSISLDRIDSSKGYIPGNIQFVCQWVNTAKKQHSNDEFLAVLDAYYHQRRNDEAKLTRSLADAGVEVVGGIE